MVVHLQLARAVQRCGTNCHPERSAAESKDPVESFVRFAAGFLDFARNDALAAFGTWNFRDLGGRGWLNILETRSVELRKGSRVYIANTTDNGIIKIGSAD